MSLIGPSGCGKSTLLRLIGDLVKPSAGEIVVNDKPAERARRDRDYGMVFQAPVLFEWRTVAENVELPLEIMGFAGRPEDDAARPTARSRRALGVRRASSLAAVGRACSSASRSPAPSRSTRSSC